MERYATEPPEFLEDVEYSPRFHRLSIGSQPDRDSCDPLQIINLHRQERAYCFRQAIRCFRMRTQNLQFSDEPSFLEARFTHELHPATEADAHGREQRQQGTQ
jgi:hypothetical protein